jgi:gluconate 5-dehydrogenase/3-oxoacyl-[acyl-carrier protein] reductase
MALEATFDLGGKTAVVTGASRGIGEACVRALDGAGARVALVARSTDAMRSIAAELRNQPVVVTADLVKDEDVRRVADDVRASLGHVDILVNNAGFMGTTEPPHAITATAMDLQLDLNLRNVIVLTSLLGPALVERKGCVVNISSVAAHVAGGNGLVYAATKGGLNSVTRILGTAWGREGVRVNGVSPGYVATDIWAELEQRLGPEGAEEFRRTKAAGVPLGRWASAEEIASVVVFLCTDAASYIAAQTITVDGGGA